jgi:hypothetical protein
MAKLVQLPGQTRTNVLIVLNDKNPALVVTALDHLVENFGAERLAEGPFLFDHTDLPPEVFGIYHNRMWRQMKRGASVKGAGANPARLVEY